MYQQQPPPQWQPPRPRPKKPVPKWVWWIAGGWVAAFAVAAVLVAVFDPPKDTSAAPSSSAVAPASAKTTAKTPAQPKPQWPPQAVPVTKAQLGKDWPFRDVTRGYVGCDAEHPGAIVFNSGDGPYLAKPFALNGTALDAGYPDVPKSIWLPDPSIPDSQARMSVGPLQDLAPNRCEP